MVSGFQLLPYSTLYESWMVQMMPEFRLMSVWFSCVQAFELATGDYLFDPQAGATFSREEGLSLISLWWITGLLFQYLPLCFQTISPTSSSCWDPSLPSLHFPDETRNDTSTARVKLRQSRVL